MDTMLLGRTTYDGFAGAFGNGPADNPVVARMNRPAKVVATSTPDTVAWANSTAPTGDLLTGVRALKQQPGGSISVIGSITPARTLLAAGLIDELSLILHPPVVGAGTRLFPATGPGASFTLTSCRPPKSGVIHLVHTAA